MSLIKKLDPNNHIISFYLLGCTLSFLFSEIIKYSPLIKNDMRKYNRCLFLLGKNLINDDNLKKICRLLNNKENFQGFVYNLFYTWLLIYALIREIIEKNFFGLLYWIIVHISILSFSLLDELSFLEFSIDSESNYSIIQKIVIYSIGGICCILSIIQVYKKKVKMGLIFKFILVYLILFLLLFHTSNKIIFHFHHSLISGFLSLFFIDFSSKFSLYIHAILIGIVIQGFNFFSLGEIFMFYISNNVPPDISFLLILYSIFLLLIIFLNKIKDYYIKKKRRR